MDGAAAAAAVVAVTVEVTASPVMVESGCETSVFSVPFGCEVVPGFVIVG